MDWLYSIVVWRKIGLYLATPLNLTADDAAELGDNVLNSDHTSGAVLALRQQVAVHLVDDVADGLLSDLEIVSLRAVTRRVHYCRHVDTAALADKPPDEARHERQHRLSRTSTNYNINNNFIMMIGHNVNIILSNV